MGGSTEQVSWKGVPRSWASGSSSVGIFEGEGRGD